MSSAKIAATQVKCPHCGNKFSPEAALEHEYRRKMEEEYDQRLTEQAKQLELRIRNAEAEKFKAMLKSVEQDREAKVARLRELEEKSVDLVERERRLSERQEQLEVEMRRRWLEREKILKEELEKKALTKVSIELDERQRKLEEEREELQMHMKKAVQEAAEKVREQEQLRMAELQKKLDDQTRLINEMKRKSEQGSMQTQGEVQELAIEEFLITHFRRDEVEEVAKGKRGGDCVHIVNDAYGQPCGKILYESKRTKVFGSDWTTKLKEDMRLTQADIGVIVTEVLPSDMTRFGLYDGVWVCTFSEFKALSMLFRESLSRVGEVRKTQENKGEKMHMLYQYLTSLEFKQKIEAIVESFTILQDDLTKERAQTMARWSKREKHLAKVLESTAALYGDVRGIAGNAVREINALEEDEVKMLVAR